MKEFIYINGRRHRMETVSPTAFYADSDYLPGRRCSYHTISSGLVSLKLGSIRTGGNIYSLRGPEWSEFTLDGIKGKVYANGWLQWHTLNCDVNCTFSAELRQIVDRLYGELQARAVSQHWH